MAITTRQIGSFVATDDSGKPYKLIVYQDFDQSRDFDGRVTEKAGLPWVCTEDGEHLNRLSKGEYELIGSGLKLHSIDADAI